MPGKHIMGGSGSRNILWRVQRYRRAGILADQVGEVRFSLWNQYLSRFQPRDFIKELVNPPVPIKLGCEEFARTNVGDSESGNRIAHYRGNQIVIRLGIKK